jgi:hypothetical protein
LMKSEKTTTRHRHHHRKNRNPRSSAKIRG